MPLVPSRTPNKNRLFVALVCVVVPGVLLVSFLPGNDKERLHTEGRFHSLGHLLAFSLLTFVAARTFRSRRARMVTVVSSAVLGLQIELLQYLVFRGAMEWKDVFVDTLGVLAGTLLAIMSSPSTE